MADHPDSDGETPKSAPHAAGAAKDAPASKEEAPARPARVKSSIEERIAAATAARAAAASPRPHDRPALTPRGPTGAASHLADIASVLEQVRKSAHAVDESRVRRSYRGWVNWLIARSRIDSLCIAVLPGPRWEEFAKELGVAGTMSGEPAFELHRADSGQRADRPWPRLPCSSVPEGLSLLVINDLKLFSKEWDMIAAMRRDCALAVAFPDALEAPYASLFDRLAIGLVRLSDSGPPRAASNPVQHRFGASMAKGGGLVAGLTRVVPTSLRESMRAMMIANDLAAIGSALQREEEQGSARASILAASESTRVRRSEVQRLSLELEQLVGARTDLAAEVKTILTSLRQQRGEVESGSLVEQSTTSAFDSLISRFDPSSDESLDSLIQTRPKRTWWEGTKFEYFSWFFSKKSEAQLDSNVLNASLAEVERSSLRWLGKVAVQHVSEFNRMIETVGLTYFGGNSPISTYLAEKVYLDNYILGAPAPPGGAAPESSLASKMVGAAQAAFRSFSANEVRAFRIERERRGFVGQLTEARSAVFGIYFLLLMGVRLVPPMECVSQASITAKTEEIARASESARPALQVQLADMQAALENWTNGFACWANESLNYDLRVTLMALILVGLLVNIFSQPRQERAMLADRVQAKLDELRSRLTTFLDRFLKEQLTLLETTLVDQASLIDADFERRRAATQAKLDALRAAAGPTRTERPPSIRPVQLGEQTRKLAARVRDDFQAEYAAALADT
ncbi:MAG: hypothetical protein ABL912_04315 [Novosphingobium sp.]